MKFRIFYTPNTPADHDIAYLQQRLETNHISPELIDTNTIDGAGIAQSYDILARPASMVIADDGSVLQQWSGLPSAEEVTGIFGGL